MERKKNYKTYTFQVSWQLEPFIWFGSLSTKPALCKGWYNEGRQLGIKKVIGYCILIKKKEMNARVRENRKVFSRRWEWKQQWCIIVCIKKFWYDDVEWQWFFKEDAITLRQIKNILWGWKLKKEGKELG